MRFLFIRAEKANYPVQLMCEVLRVSKQGFSAFCKREEQRRRREAKEAALVALVKEAHRQGRCVGGYRPVHQALQKQGVRTNKHKVAQIMKEHGLQARPPKRFQKTTNSRHGEGVSPNLLGRDFTADAPNQKWLSDITYIWTGEGWMYLATILDLYSRQIVGWRTSSSLDASFVVEALKDAIGKRRPPAGLIVHSDRGVQYASRAFRAVVEEHGMLQSMSGKGDCWDNAPMESFFSTLKRELVDVVRFSTRMEARRALFSYIEVFYNRQRLHSSLGYQSPAEFEQRRVAA